MAVAAAEPPAETPAIAQADAQAGEDGLIPAADPLPAPTGFAVAQSGDGLALSWQAVAGADAYRVTIDGADSYITASATDVIITFGAEASRLVTVAAAQAKPNPAEGYIDGAVSEKIALYKPLGVPTPTDLRKIGGTARLEWPVVAGADGYLLYTASASLGADGQSPAEPIESYAERAITPTISADGASFDVAMEMGKYYSFKLASAHTKRTDADQHWFDKSAPSTATDIYSAPSDATFKVFTAEADGWDSAVLGWEAVAGATGYSVYRAAKQAGPYTLEATGGAEMTGWVDDGLTSGKTYWYMVYALKDGAVMAQSPRRSVKPGPTVPENFTVTAPAGSYNTLRLSWTAVKGASGYTIDRAEKPEDGKAPVFKTIYTAGAGAAGYTDDGLQRGEYLYRIRTRVTVAGKKQYSAYTEIKSASVRVLPAPADISCTTDERHALVLSWDRVFAAQGYNIYVSTPFEKGKLLAKTTSVDATSYTHTGVSGIPHSYRVTPWKKSGDTLLLGDSATITDLLPQTLPAPGGVTASSTSNHTVKLKWDKVTGAAGYYIYRADAENGKYSLVATIESAGTLTYTHEGVPFGRWYYKVAAYTTVKNSALASVASAPVQVDVASLVGMPQNFATDTDLNGVVNLTWDREPTRRATGYYVYRQDKPGGAFKRIATITSGSTTRYADNLLPADGPDTYVYQVSAYAKVSGKACEGERTEALAVRPRWLEAERFEADVSTAHAATLSWNQVTGASGYYIYRASEAGGPYKQVKKITRGTTTSYTNTKLAPGNWYYKIAPYGKSGKKQLTGRLSAPITAAVTTFAAPNITSLASVAGKYNTARINWTKVDGATGYHILWQDPDAPRDAAPVLVATVKGGKKSSYLIKNVPMGDQSYSVAAYKTISGKVWRGTASAPELVTPDHLGAASITDIAPTGYHAMKVEWQKVTGAQGYLLQQSPTEDGPYTTVATISSGKSVRGTMKGLPAGKLYFRVLAYRKVGGKILTGLESAPASGSPRLLDEVDGLWAEPVDYFKAKLHWERVDGASGYLVYRSTSEQGAYRLVGKTTSRTKTTFTDKSVEARDYYYKVVACKTYGKTAYAGPLPTRAEKLTGDGMAAPGSVGAVESGYYGAKVSWSKVTGAGGYEVFYSDAENGVYKSGGRVSAPATSLTVTGLRDADTYYFQVRAFVTVDGRRLYGTEKAAASSVKPRALGAPDNVKAVDGIRSIKVSWKKMSDVSGYIIYVNTGEKGPDGEAGYEEAGRASADATSHTLHGLAPKGCLVKVSAYKTFGLEEVEGPLSASAGGTSEKVPDMTLKKAEKSGYSSIRLSWEADDRVDGYIIERKVGDGGSYSEYARLKSGKTSEYIDTSPVAQKDNYYRIRAYVSHAGSTYKGAVSNEKSQMPNTLTKVTGFTVTSESKTSLYLDWTTSHGSEGYYIYRRTETTDFVMIAKQKGEAATSYRDVNLETGKLYSYKVVAFRTLNKTEYKAPASATVSARPVTGKVDTFRVSAISGLKVTLSWVDISDATGYRIYCGTNKNKPTGFAMVKEIASADERSYIDNLGERGKKAGTYYYYIVPIRKIGTTVYEGARSDFAEAVVTG